MIFTAQRKSDLEFVILEKSAESIYECQKFIQGGQLDNHSCNMAQDAWYNYIEIVRNEGGIKINNSPVCHFRKFAKFGDVILKNEQNKFEAYTIDEFSEKFISHLYIPKLEKTMLVL